MTDSRADLKYCLRCEVRIYRDGRGLWRRLSTGSAICPRNPAGDGHEPLMLLPRMDDVREIMVMSSPAHERHTMVNFTNGSTVCSCGMIRGELPNLREEE